MTKRILLAVLALGMLSACVSGTKPADTYVGQDGKVTRIESDREMCQRSCNQDYSRCMDSSAASDNSGINGPSGVFGASGDCRKQLQKCLPGCKGQ
jgi:hypothetical protein